VRMSFAKDILGIPKKGASSSGLPTEFAASPPQPVSRKKEGVPRELLHLGGGISSSPTIAPSVSFKEKPQQKVSWHRKAFSNSARTDELKLSQWTKDEIVGEYPFAKFNRKVKIVEYSDEDYKSMLNNFQPLPKKSEKEPNGFEPWTREETDELFKMCIEYDLRFVVINDRWPPKFKPRSIDELKDRYFSVARKILESRQKAKQPAPTGAFAKHCSAIVLNPYDIEYELLRKKQLEAQYKRSKGELRQEEETVREARRIEANRKRILKERQRIQKLLLPAGDIAVTDVDEAGPARGQKSRSMKMTIPGTVEPILTLPTKSFQHRKSWNCAHARSSFIYQSIKQSARLAKRVEVGTTLLFFPADGSQLTVKKGALETQVPQ